MPHLRQSDASISFQVADVAPGDNPLETICARESLRDNAQTRIVACSNPAQQLVAGADFHPLIAAASLAYQNHFPLVLYPDAIWLTILQGVAQHVANHPEALRARLVSHQTKIELVIEGGKAPETDAEMLRATRAFLECIEKHCAPNKRFLLHTEFSGTTDLARIAAAVTFMDLFQPYFDYVFQIICGIPSVTLEGSPEDWDLLAEKTALLHESDLDLSWWTKHLLPLCAQFTRAARGDVDPIHWGNLCKIRQHYGVNDLNGWILKFVPYIRRDKNSAATERNPVLELSTYPRSKSWREQDALGNRITGCTSNMLPNGLSSAPVAFQELTSGQVAQRQFIAGFVGVVQSPQDLSVRAQLGWAIGAQSRIDRLLARVREEADTKPPLQLGPGELVRRVGGGLPGDICKFHATFETAEFDYDASDGENTHVRILPAYELNRIMDGFACTREIHHLRENGLISKKAADERIDFIRKYHELVAFASVRGQTNGQYLFGYDPDGERQECGQIFFWNCHHRPEGFQWVAASFADWLEQLLDTKRAPTSPS